MMLALFVGPPSSAFAPELEAPTQQTRLSVLARTQTAPAQPELRFKGARRTAVSQILVPRPNTREIHETMFCRILVFMWSSGARRCEGQKTPL